MQRDIRGLLNQELSGLEEGREGTVPCECAIVNWGKDSAGVWPLEGSISRVRGGTRWEVRVC